MSSNVINLSAELEAREHRRKLTPKQEITIRLRDYYSKQSRLIKAIRFQKVAQKRRIREYIEITERIDLEEERLLSKE